MTDQGRFRDRIVDFRRVKGSDLKANPKNWRQHPDQQRRALEKLMDTVGIAGALIAYTGEGDDLILLDGHLRRDLDPNQEYPTLVTDLNEEEADLFLATYDPLSEMATADVTQLETLMSSVWFSDEEIQDSLQGIADLYDIDLGWGDLEGHEGRLPTDAVEIIIKVAKADYDDLIRAEVAKAVRPYNLKVKVRGTEG